LENENGKAHGEPGRYTGGGERENEIRKGNQRRSAIIGNYEVDEQGR
jgi:hypothetical protein